MPTTTSPVLTQLFADSIAEAVRLRPHILPVGHRSEMLEALLLQVKAAEALAMVNEDTAAAELARPVLDLLQSLILTLYPLPTLDSGYIAIDNVELIARQVIVSVQLLSESEDLFERIYWWVVKNAVTYRSTGTLISSQMFLRTAKMFWDQNLKELGLALLARAFLAAQMTTPNSVLELAASAADIIAALDEGKTLWATMDLLESTDAWLMKISKIVL